MSGERGDNQYLVASLEKGLHVLGVVARSPTPMRLPEVAAAAGYPSATTYRLLRTLEHHGFLRMLEGQRFAPGIAVLTLGFDTLASLDIVQVASPVLTRAAQITGESSNLSVLANQSVMILFRTVATTLVRPAADVGKLLPSTCTSAGKALLAGLDPDDLAEQLRDVDFSTARGPNAIRDLETLLRDLDQVRERGWAMQDQEIAAGLRSIAACVYDATGAPVAAANLSFTATLVDAETMVDKYVPVLLEATAEISGLLGARTR